LKSNLPSFLEHPDPNIYLENRYVVADFETSNRDKGSALNRTNRIVLATWLERSSKIYPKDRDIHDSQSVVQSQFGSEFEQQRLVKAIQACRFFVAHQSKFELQWLHRAGLDLSTVLVWDTLIAEYVIAGNRKVDLSLEGTAERYSLGRKVSVVKQLIEGGVCPSEIPEQWLLEYCSADTLLCHKIFLKQREILANEGLLPAMYARCLLTPVLADIELRGTQLDAERVKEEYDRTYSERQEAYRRLSQFSGDINWRSPNQVSELLYGELGFHELSRRGSPLRTATGRPRTDADAIEELAVLTQQQMEFKDAYRVFKKSEKRLQNLEKLKACVEENAGLLHFQFNQTVTGTGRLSSSGLKYKVQGQNVDRSLKSLWKARNEGWKVGEADAVQLEFRVAAHLGNDPVAQSDMRTAGWDVHWQTAEAYYRKSRKQLTKEDRYNCKPRTFRPLYGATTGDVGERRYIKFFQERYAKIYETQSRWAMDVLQTKKIKTATGIIFYWPDAHLKPTADGRGYISVRTAVFNYPIQSLATADMVPISLIFMWHRIKAERLQMFLVGTVHDSVVAEIPPDEQRTFGELAKRCFTVDCCDYLSRVYNLHYISLLGCETKIGDHWGEGTEEKYDWDPITRKAA